MFKKILTIIVSLTLVLQTSYAATEYNITSVNSSNANMLRVFLDSELSSVSKDLFGDIKVFKDIKTQSVLKDLDDDTKLRITLSEPLKENTDYSFLSVYGVEGNIDFSLASELSGVEITNPDPSENAKSVFISSPTTLEVVFKTSIIQEEVDIKVLRSLGVDSINLNLEDKKELKISMLDSLDETNDYILMLFSLKTAEGEDISIANSIYDFKTELFNINEVIEPPVIDNIIPEVSDQNGVNLNGEVNDVALNAAETPDTGAETWVLFALTFFMSSAIFIRRKFSK